MSVAKKPVNAATDLMADMTDAVVSAELSALSVLKAEMEGLSVLFGGESAPKTEAEQRALDADKEADFDNMPI